MKMSEMNLESIKQPPPLSAGELRKILKNVEDKKEKYKKLFYEVRLEADNLKSEVLALKNRLRVIHKKSKV